MRNGIFAFVLYYVNAWNTYYLDVFYVTVRPRTVTALLFLFYTWNGFFFRFFVLLFYNDKCDKFWLLCTMILVYS